MTFDEYIESVKVILKNNKNISVEHYEFKFSFEELKLVLQEVWNHSRILMVTN